MDPLSIIVTTLVVGAASGLQSTDEQAVREAYRGIKSLIQQKYKNVHLNLLEEDPISRPYQAVIKADLAKTDAAKDQELLQRAQTLLDAVEQHDPQATSTVGAGLEDIRSASLILQQLLNAGSGANVGGSVQVEGGDFVGRDKTVQGDEVRGDKVQGDKVGGDSISVGNISGSQGVAIGRGASANVTSSGRSQKRRSQ